jgi:CheY-specific phosphatase CheX
MNIENELVSKILVCDLNEKACNTLKTFFVAKGLVGLSCQSDDVQNLLERSTDLGAIFLSHDYQFKGMQGLELARYFHQGRPELPLFYRIESGQNMTLEAAEVSGVYNINNLDFLTKLVDEHLFSMIYPVPLIRGIQEISQGAFSTVINGVNVTCDKPYLVKDQIIYGELLSLIPLESSWCRGFMMLQTTQVQMMEMIKQGKTQLSNRNAGFRDVNELLNEITNLIWGKIKSSFFKESKELSVPVTRIQVPILVNHLEKYISFGSKEPQLCFRYTLTSEDDPKTSIVIFQKMVFNLSWNPSEFQKCAEETDELVDCGELEFF